MPCGLHASHTETYQKSYKDWGWVSTQRRRKNEAINRVKELIIQKIHKYVRDVIGSCPEECPKQIVVISFSSCTINVHDKAIRRIDYYDWRYEINCTWKVDVYCLRENERLVPEGEVAGGNCGLRTEEAGSSTGQGMSIINGDFACEMAKDNAYLRAFEDINRIADSVQCPEECPKKFISFWFGEPTCATPNYIKAEREWRVEAQQPWKVWIYCLPEDGGFRVATAEKGGKKEMKEKEKKEKKRRKRKVKKQ